MTGVQTCALPISGTLFQVYVGNSTCRRINVSSSVSASAQVQYKEWTQRNWSFAPGSSDIGAGLRGIPLPITLGGGWRPVFGELPDSMVDAFPDVAVGSVEGRVWSRSRGR